MPAWICLVFTESKINESTGKPLLLKWSIKNPQANKSWRKSLPLDLLQIKVTGHLQIEMKEVTIRNGTKVHDSVVKAGTRSNSAYSYAIVHKSLSKKFSTWLKPLQLKTQHSSLNTYITPLYSKAQGKSQKSRQKDLWAGRGELFQDKIFRTWQDTCTNEIIVAVIACIRLIQLKFHHRWKKSSCSSIAFWESIASWWPVEEEDLVFFKSVVHSRLPMIQRISMYTCICGHHYLYAEVIKRSKWNIKRIWSWEKDVISGSEKIWEKSGGGWTWSKYTTSMYKILQEWIKYIYKCRLW